MSFGPAPSSSKGGAKGGAGRLQGNNSTATIANHNGGQPPDLSGLTIMGSNAATTATKTTTTASAGGATQMAPSSSVPSPPPSHPPTTTRSGGVAATGGASPQGKLRHGGGGGGQQQQQTISDRQRRLMGGASDSDDDDSGGSDGSGDERILPSSSTAVPTQQSGSDKTTATTTSSRVRSNLRELVTSNRGEEGNGRGASSSVGGGPRTISTPPATTNAAAAIPSSDRSGISSAPTSTMNTTTTTTTNTSKPSAAAARLPFRSHHHSGSVGSSPSHHLLRSSSSAAAVADDAEGLEALLYAVNATNDDLLEALETPALLGAERAMSRAGTAQRQQGGGGGTMNRGRIGDSSPTDAVVGGDDAIHNDARHYSNDDEDSLVRASTAASSIATTAATSMYAPSNASSTFSKRSDAARWWRSRGKKNIAAPSTTTAVMTVADANGAAVGASSPRQPSESVVLMRSLSVSALSRLEESNKGSNAATAPNPTNPSATANNGTSSGGGGGGVLLTSLPLTADGTAIALSTADIACIKDPETLQFLQDNSRWLTKYIVEREKQNQDEAALKRRQEEALAGGGGGQASGTDGVAAAVTEEACCDSTADLTSTFLTAVDTEGRSYNIAVVVPPPSRQRQQEGGSASGGTHAVATVGDAEPQSLAFPPPALEIPLELIDYDIDYEGRPNGDGDDHDADNEKDLSGFEDILGSSDGGVGGGIGVGRSERQFASEYDANVVLDSLILEELGGGGGPLLPPTASASSPLSGGGGSHATTTTAESEEDTIVRLMLEARLRTDDDNAEAEGRTSALSNLMLMEKKRREEAENNKKTSLNQIPSLKEDGGAGATATDADTIAEEDLDEKAIAARVDEAKIRARMRSQQTFLTSLKQTSTNATTTNTDGGTHQQSPADVSTISVASSVASSLLAFNVGVTEQHLAQLRQAREFALARRLEALKAKMAAAQQRRMDDVDRLQHIIESGGKLDEADFNSNGRITIAMATSGSSSGDHPDVANRAPPQEPLPKAMILSAAGGGGGGGVSGGNNKSSFGVQYCGKRKNTAATAADPNPSSAATAPTPSSSSSMPQTPYALMQHRLQQQLDSYRARKQQLLAQEAHEAEGRRRLLQGIGAVMGGDDDSQSSTAANAPRNTTNNTNNSVQQGLAKAAAKAQGKLLTADESRRVDALLAYEGLWGVVDSHNGTGGNGGGGGAPLDNGGAVTSAAAAAGASAPLSAVLDQLLGDGYALEPSHQRRVESIDDQLSRLQRAREQLAYAKVAACADPMADEEEGSVGSPPHSNGGGGGGTDDARSVRSIKSNASVATTNGGNSSSSLVGLAKMDSSLLSPNVSALLHRLGQAHERQLKEQRLEQAREREGLSSISSSHPSTATAAATTNVAANGGAAAPPPSDLRTLEQIEDAKMDSQRRRLGNLYLRQAADAKLQRAYMKQLNAELEKIYTQNEALASDPSFAVARKYDLYKDPTALFAKEFPEGIAPVTSEQLEALLGAAKAEEEVLLQVGGEDGSSSPAAGAASEVAAVSSSADAGGGGGAPSAAAASSAVTTGEAQDAVVQKVVLLTPFQEALRDRLARAQRLVTEAKEGPLRRTPQPEGQHVGEGEGGEEKAATTGDGAASGAEPSDAGAGDDDDGDDPSLPPLPPPEEVERMLLEQRKAREARLAELKRQLEALGINSSAAEAEAPAAAC